MFIVAVKQQRKVGTRILYTKFHRNICDITTCLSSHISVHLFVNDIYHLSTNEDARWYIILKYPLGAHYKCKHRWFSGRMLACHAGGPGSIPGRCIVFFFFSFIFRLCKFFFPFSFTTLIFLVCPFFSFFVC